MFYNSLLAADLQISELLQFFDQDGDGSVSSRECTKALTSLDLGLSPEQIRQLVALLGFDKAKGDDDDVDLQAFFKRLAQLADHTVIARSDQELSDLQQIARWIDGVCKAGNKSLSELFKSWDDNSDGYIDYDELVQCLFTTQEKLYLSDPSSVDYIYTREEFDELARTVDQAKTGRINYLSFLGLFSAAEAAGKGEGLSPLLSRTTASSIFTEAVCATLWAHEGELMRAFRSADPKHTGCVAPAKFQAALEAMNNALAPPHQPITAAQMEKVVHALPLNAEGQVNYVEFFAAFEVRDKCHDA